jgi:hypothetical protein
MVKFPTQSGKVELDSDFDIVKAGAQKICGQLTCQAMAKNDIVAVIAGSLANFTIRPVQSGER